MLRQADVLRQSLYYYYYYYDSDYNIFIWNPTIDNRQFFGTFSQFVYVFQRLLVSVDRWNCFFHHRHPMDPRAEAARKRLRKKFAQRRPDVEESGAGEVIKLPAAMTEEDIEAQLRRAATETKISSLSHDRKGMFLAVLKKTLSFILAALDAKDFARITQYFPQIDPEKEFSHVRKTVEDAFADVGYVDVSHSITKTEFLSDDVGVADGKFQVILPIEAYLNNKESVKWLFDAYLAMHIKRDSVLGMVDAWSFLTSVIVLSSDGSQRWVRPEVLPATQMRRMFLDHECQVCLQTSKDRMVTFAVAYDDPNRKHPLRHPLRIAMCSSGDTQLCMTCFAQISSCPVCKAPIESFKLSHVPASRIDKIVKSSANECAAQKTAEEMKEAEFQEFLKSCPRSKTVRDRHVREILMATPDDEVNFPMEAFDRAQYDTSAFLKEAFDRLMDRKEPCD